ncbi:hypothetical protein BJ742DRAFT_81262 [Cladochytrium replicatum]|nr:hypothetical protein BJ742DRAFT_81262 [Cladochytrium replicatum]
MECLLSQNERGYDGSNRSTMGGRACYSRSTREVCMAATSRVTGVRESRHEPAQLHLSSSGTPCYCTFPFVHRPAPSSNTGNPVAAPPSPQLPQPMLSNLASFVAWAYKTKCLDEVYGGIDVPPLMEKHSHPLNQEVTVDTNVLFQIRNELPYLSQIRRQRLDLRNFRQFVQCMIDVLNPPLSLLLLALKYVLRYHEKRGQVLRNVIETYRRQPAIYQAIHELSASLSPPDPSFLFAMSFVLAQKYADDFAFHASLASGKPYDTPVSGCGNIWTLMMGIPGSELRRGEFCLLSTLEYRLHVSVAEYTQWHSLVVALSDDWTRWVENHETPLERQERLLIASVKRLERNRAIALGEFAGSNDSVHLEMPTDSIVSPQLTILRRIPSPVDPDTMPIYIHRQMIKPASNSILGPSINHFAFRVARSGYLEQTALSGEEPVTNNKRGKGENEPNAFRTGHILVQGSFSFAPKTFAHDHYEPPTPITASTIERSSYENGGTGKCNPITPFVKPAIFGGVAMRRKRICD